MNGWLRGGATSFAWSTTGAGSVSSSIPDFKNMVANRFAALTAMLSNRFAGWMTTTVRRAYVLPRACIRSR
jgi:hypothetical protein